MIRYLHTIIDVRHLLLPFLNFLLREQPREIPIFSSDLRVRSWCQNALGSESQPSRSGASFNPWGHRRLTSKMCINSPEGVAKELKGSSFYICRQQRRAHFVSWMHRFSTRLKKQALVSHRLRALCHSFHTLSASLVLITIYNVSVLRSFFAAFEPSHSCDSRSSRLGFGCCG